MTSAGDGAGSGRPAGDAAHRPKPGLSKPDRRAEALRANLKRRKAQVRARGEARHGEAPPTPPEADVPGADG